MRHPHGLSMVSSLAACAALTAGAAACGGGPKAPSSAPSEPSDEPPAEPADPHAAYGKLEVGANYASWTEANDASFESPTHGGRFVDVYVNDVGYDAYVGGGAMPVGSVVVKTSRETEDGEPTDVAGPIFVMEKREAGFAPENGDWWYALHWAEVPADWQGRMGERVYWRTPSERVGYCSGCHNDYDRQLGGVPDEHRVAADR